MKSKMVFLLAGFLFSQTVLFAHPGRTDKNGGHKGPNGYHYHNGGSSSGSSSSSYKNSGSSGSSSSSAGSSDNVYITSPEEMKELQTLLTSFGFYNGPTDGNINSEGTIESANKARIKYELADPEYSRLVRRSLLVKLRTVKAGL